MSVKLSEFFGKIKAKQRPGIISSFAVLLLTSVLLVTSVLAWFASGGFAEAKGFSISVSTSDNVTVSHGSASLTETVFVPAATKPADAEITAPSLAKVLVFKWYKVETDEADYVSLRFDLEDDGLICYCFTVDGEETIGNMTQQYCAEKIKTDTGNLICFDDDISSVVNSPQRLVLDNGVCYVIVVFMADYDKVWSDPEAYLTSMTAGLTFIPVS